MTDSTTPYSSGSYTSNDEDVMAYQAQGHSDQTLFESSSSHPAAGNSQPTTQPFNTPYSSGSYTSNDEDVVAYQAQGHSDQTLFESSSSHPAPGNSQPTIQPFNADQPRPSLRYTARPPHAVPLEPAFVGFLWSTTDALLVIQQALNGQLPMVIRRPTEYQRKTMIKSGFNYCYQEDTSGIKRWTDDITWSPSRSVCGNFLVYRETVKPRGGQKLRAIKQPGKAPRKGLSSSSRVDPLSRGSHSSLSSESPEQELHDGQEGDKVDTSRDHDIIGSLVDTYHFVADGWIKRTFSIRKLDSPDQVHIVGYLKLDHARKMLDMPECTPTGQSRIDPASKFRGVWPDWTVLNRKTLKNPNDIIPLQVQDSIPAASSGQAPSMSFYPVMSNNLVAAHVLPLQMPQHLEQVHQPQQQNFAAFVPFAANPYQPNGFIQSPVEGYAPDAEEIHQQQQYSYASVLQHPHQHQHPSQPQPVTADCMSFIEQPEGQEFVMNRYQLPHTQMQHPMLESSQEPGLPYAPNVTFTMPSSTEAVYATGGYTEPTLHGCLQLQPEQEQDQMALYPSADYSQ